VFDHKIRRGEAGTAIETAIKQIVNRQPQGGGAQTPRVKG